MRIKLSPVRGDKPLLLVKSGDTLIVNGEAYDFSQVLEGDVLPQSAVSGDWLASDVRREDGRLYLTVLMPHGPEAPLETRFPDLLDVGADGIIALPVFGAQSTADEGDAQNV